MEESDIKNKIKNRYLRKNKEQMGEEYELALFLFVPIWTVVRLHYGNLYPPPSSPAPIQLSRRPKSFFIGEGKRRQTRMPHPLLPLVSILKPSQVNFIESLEWSSRRCKLPHPLKKNNSLTRVLIKYLIFRVANARGSRVLFLLQISDFNAQKVVSVVKSDSIRLIR